MHERTEMKLKDLYVGKQVMVFDARLWDKNGGDHKTDTFYRKATIVALWAYLADVKFEHDGRISESHYIRGMQEVPYRKEGVK